MTAARYLMVCAALASAMPAMAQAERRPEHRGFWIGFGVGGGSNLSEGRAGTRGGAGAYLRLGGTVNQQLLIGGETISWARTVNNTTVSQGNTAAVVVLYPSLAGGLFLKSGLGFATSVASLSQGNATLTVTDVGFGATFGGGYDLQLGDNFFLTPNLDFLIQTIEGATGAVILLTVGATWH